VEAAATAALLVEAAVIRAAALVVVGATVAVVEDLAVVALPVGIRPEAPRVVARS
jgi:hypothetical protein